MDTKGKPVTITEPPIRPSDTQPRKPASPQPAPPPDWFIPIDRDGLLSPEEEIRGTPCLLSVVVIMATACLCMMIISLSMLAGYRDELKAIRTQEAKDFAKTAVVHYELALQNQENGLFELAYDRLAWITTRQPDYRDAAQRLQALQSMLVYTPTPSPTDTPAASPTPTLTPMAEVTATPTIAPIEQYYANATKFYSFGRYEEAIEWLQIVIDTDPTYRRDEIDRMLFDSYIKQAIIYFRAQNSAVEDGPMGLAGNQLARGILYTNQAITLHRSNPNVGSWNDIPHTEAYIATLFQTARNYVESGQADLARTALDELCALNCNWEYFGLSVRTLRQRAGLN